MFETWSPKVMAFYSMAIMMIPAAILTISVLISTAMNVISRNLSLNSNTPIGSGIDKLSGNIHFVTFICVLLMNFAAAGLLISGVWALIDLAVGLVS